MKKNYYFFYLEIALRDSNNSKIYAVENISHIPTKRLIEIFKINLKKDPQILEGYILTKTSFKKHKAYLIKNIGHIDLDLFEYCLRQYASTDFGDIRKLYKEDLIE